MVMFSFLILGTAFVFLGRSYVISEYRDNMVSNAEEVSHAAQALVRDGELELGPAHGHQYPGAVDRQPHLHHGYRWDDRVLLVPQHRLRAPGRTVGSAQLTQLRSDGKLNLITNLGGFMPRRTTSSRSRSPSARTRA